MFSREIFNLAKKYIKEDKLKNIEKYQSFFIGNVEDLIEANDISLFDKNSYTYDDLSMNPDISKRTHLSISERIQFKKQESNSIACQLDLSKIKHLFLQANIKDK